jgi:hypothetical protein
MWKKTNRLKQDMKELKGLAPSTEKLLLKLSKFELLQDFSFVGGSALAIRLQHRQSEDIDLFTWHRTLDKENIFTALRMLETPFSILNSSDIQINVIAENVKLTFFAQGRDVLKDRELIKGNLYTVPVETLTGMKVNTLFLRAKFRDYYDLFVLNKEVFSIEAIFKIGQKIMPELTMKLFQTSLVYTKDIAEDNIHHLSPRYKISIDEIAIHFQNEIEKWLSRCD